MATGQVGFKDQKKVKKVLVKERENPIINRLNKTKVEKHPDLAMEKQEHLKSLSKKNLAAVRARKKEEERIAKERQQLKYQKDHAYDELFTEENMVAASNQDKDEHYYSDDFM
jgi:hypothetical protein